MDRGSAPAPGAVRPFEFPRVERHRLANGLVVLAVRSGALPLVTVRAVLDAGAAAERDGEEGLAWLVAQALEGGTARRSGDELAWALERLGAELETRTTWDTVHAAFTVRSDRLDEALSLLSEIVREPAFAEREVARLRDEQLAEMLRRRTDPRGLADDSAAHYIFADSSPYARPLLGTEERVRAHDAAAARAYHQRRYTPGNAAVVVVGDVAAEDAVRHMQAAFGDWTAPHDATPTPDTQPRSTAGGVHIVNREGAVQSELRIGHVGVPRHHPDYHALLVANAALGGAFISRLNLNLREKHGFTYGVRSGFAWRRGAGPFIIQTAVASDVTARAVEETLREVRALQEDGLSDDELRAARDFLAGTLPLAMQTTEQLSAMVADLHTFDLPADYFEHHQQAIMGISRDDIARVVRQHIRPDELAIVVVGNENVDGVRQVTDVVAATERN